MVKRFEIYLINLDDEVSKDPKNTRPCVIISPDEMNGSVDHVVIAPISSGTGVYPTRVPTELLNSKRFIVLDQLRAIETGRLVKRIGEIDAATQKLTLDTLQEFFAA